MSEKETFIDQANTKVESYNCPNCDAALKYKPETQVLYCEYCDYQLKIKGYVGKYEHDFFKRSKDHQNWKDETKVVHCDNCGANTIVDNGSMSFICPFCGSTSVIETTELPGLRPDRVIPFKISQKTILSNYQNWLKRKFYVPKKVKKQIPSLKLRGVYLPIWTFDSNTISKYDGRLGKHYTRTVGSGKNRRTVTETRYFHINGELDLSFDDIIINAGKKINQREIDKLKPFITNDSFLYTKSYLVGFSAEHYTISLEDGWKSSQIIMKDKIKSKVLSKYNYDVISYLNIDTSYEEVLYKYVLIPVWIGSYRYKKKTYRFLSNGENGVITGKHPISALKILFTISIIILIIVINVVLFNLLMNC